MTLTDKLAGIAAIFMLLAGVLFVVFGQVTVRKLRKNPETRDRLGMELLSGWDILNVATALASPKWYNDIVRGSKLSFLSADEKPLHAHTNKFDRFLAHLFCYVWFGSVFSFFFVIFLNWLGIIE